MRYLTHILLFFGSCICITRGYNFGFNNSYTCHCLNDIQCNNETGACNNRCSTPWVGPSCQKENIAYNKTVTQSGQETNQGPWLAVDGNRRYVDYKYCIDTGYSPWAWWRVDLGQPLTLGYLKIYYRSERLNNFKGFSVHIDGELCYQHTSYFNPPAVLPIECSSTITGRYVNISNNRPDDPRHYFSLCEVEIYVCSQGTYGSQCNNFCHCSNYEKCDVKTGQCPNGCQIGWNGDSCNTTCDESYGQGCSKKCTDRKCSDISTCDHVTGQCINGCQPGYQGIDCTQVCPRGTYGLDCNNFCHCSNYDKCDVKTGQCLNGCQIGWDGDSCNTTCDESYGQGCSKSCTDRKCSDISTCDHVTGQCINGCQSGYQGIDCTQECQGSYGENCNKQCSDRNCLDQSSCNNIDGKCIGGCQAGYRSLDCTQTCSTGLYGFNCHSSCSERFCKINSITCHHVTGTCSQDGCLDYYDGVDCKRYIECADGYYGFDAGCNKLCSDRNCKVLTSSCNQIDGTCESLGCLDGYQGIDCTIQVIPEANESKLSKMVYMYGSVGTAIVIVLGFLLVVIVHRCRITRKRKAEVPEAYYEDVTLETVARDSTTSIYQTIATQDTVSSSPTSSNTVGKSATNQLSSDYQQISSGTENDYYSSPNNTYEDPNDARKQNDNENDYQSLQ